jgi:cysteinyl-tRNA synthetase
LESLRKIGAVFGLLNRSPAEYFGTKRRSGLESLGLDAAAIEARIAERVAARRAKDWARADAVRDELLSQGVVLEDGPKGTTWKVKDRG